MLYLYNFYSSSMSIKPEIDIQFIVIKILYGQLKAKILQKIKKHDF